MLTKIYIHSEYKKSFNMADELKKKFHEMQEAKHGKKSEIQVDEMEWIEVSDKSVIMPFGNTVRIFHSSSTNNWPWTEPPA